MFINKKIVAIAGPTASGKSGLAVHMAKALVGEIISCDSMQVYKEMNIGTAKISYDEMKGIPHHLLGFHPIEKDFSVSDYVYAAQHAIDDVCGRGAIPIVAGGTGLYMRSLLWNVNFDLDGRDEALRVELTKRAEIGEILELYNRLIELDCVAAEKIHINNHKKVIRALEYCLVTGKKFSQQSIISEPRYDFYLLCINFRNRQKLYDRINMRVDMMMEQGLLNEAKQFYNSKSKTALQAIGYKELFPYFNGQISLGEAVENVKRESRRYAKRQITWFKAEKNVNFIYADDFENSEELYLKAEELVGNYVN